MEERRLSIYHECIEQLMDCTDDGELLLGALKAVGFGFKYDDRGALRQLTFGDNIFTSPALARHIFIMMYCWRIDSTHNVKLEKN